MIHVLKSVASRYIAPVMHEKYMIHRVNTIKHNKLNIISSHLVAHLHICLIIRFVRCAAVQKSQSEGGTGTRFTSKELRCKRETAFSLDKMSNTTIPLCCVGQSVSG